jgi:exonuclease SbcC
MRPLELILKNFLAYREQVRLSLDGIHVACLTGANGAGKSSLLDAITWALWGKARASDKDQLLHIGQHEMFVALTFEQSGQRYQVQRLYTKSGRTSKQSVLLRVYDPTSDQWLPINEHAHVRDIDEEIKRRVGLDYETFVHSAFLQQGKADAFATQTAARRKEILAEILGLAHWEAYEACAKERARECAILRAENQREIERLEAELAQAPALQQQADALRQQLDRARDDLDRAEDAYRALSNLPDQLAAAQREHKSVAENVQALKSDLAALVRELAELQRESEQYDALIAQRAQIERAEAQRQQLESEVMALDSVAREFARLESAYRAAEAELERARERLQAQAEALERQIALLEKDAAQRDLLQKQRAQTQAELTALEQQKAQQQALREQIAQLGEARAAHEARNAQVESEGKQLRSRRDVLQAAQTALCPVCNTPLSPEKRAALIAEYDEQIEALRRAYRETEQFIKVTDRQIEQLKKQAESAESALKRQEAALSKQLGTLEASLRAVENAVERAAQLRAERAALQAQLASESFAESARQRMAECERQAAALNYDPDAHDALRQELMALQETRLDAERLRQALEKSPALQRRIAEKQRQAEQKQARAAELEASLPALEARMAELAALAQQAQQLRAERDRLRATYNALTESYASLRSKLENLASIRERLRALREQLTELNTQERLYQELQSAFGKKGVPAMLIEAAIPELEMLANDLLARMSDGRMHLRFETQRGKKSGEGVIETLDILISDELGQRDYALYSGGESFRINFALRVALSQFLARRAGAQLRTLVIDEGFGSQDAVGRERLIEAINAVQDRFDLILIVTHIEELRDAFPTHIEVRKLPSGGAALTVR